MAVHSSDQGLKIPVRASQIYLHSPSWKSCASKRLVALSSETGIGERKAIVSTRLPEAVDTKRSGHKQSTAQERAIAAGGGVQFVPASQKKVRHAFEDWFAVSEPIRSEIDFVHLKIGISARAFHLYCTL